MFTLADPLQQPATVQAPTGAGAAAESTSWMMQFVREPGVLEILLASTVVATLVFVWWRLARLVTSARSRSALHDYLLGVEQALHGDLQGAHTRLQSVVQQDPENHYARLLLGKVLAELGEPAQAHTQHLYLQRAFGIESPENDLMLAQSLLGAGLAVQAAEAAQRVLERSPDRIAGWEFVYRARLQSGDFEAAASAGKRLLELVRDGSRHQQLCSDVARTLAQAGGVRLLRGDELGATAALQNARRLHASSDAVPLLAARLDAQRAGVERTVQSLLALPAAAENALVEAKGKASRLPVRATDPDAAPADASGLPMAALAGLAAPTRWSCRACGVPLATQAAECPRCQSHGSAILLEPHLVAGVESPTHTMDAIDENDAHVGRLVRTLLDEQGAARAAARSQLLGLQHRAVEELLRSAWHRTGEPQEAAIEVLRAMGPAVAPALFAASDALEQQRLLPVGSRSPAALVGRIVQGFDHAALPHVEPLFASARPEHRKILIDFFLGLADLGEFQIVLERFPPLEILHRLNKADSDVLRRFLEAVPPGHFVAESLLLEPTFYRDEAVLAAIPGARHPDVLAGVLRRRGPSRTLTKILIAALAEPALAEVAQRVLTDFGQPVLDHVLAAYTDPERCPDERVRLAHLLQQLGAMAVEPLCASFGSEPTALDDDLRRVLVGIGAAAVVPLQAAYGHSGWLEKVSVGLISRHTNRRVQIVRTLRAIASPAAETALRELGDAERDHNLRLRLQQALHELLGKDSAEEESHGQGR